MKKAIESYKKSASKGHKNSIYNLAVLYGQLGYTDESIKTYKTNEGHGLSYYNLGRIYSTDEYNVTEDYAQSLYYFSLALQFSPFATGGGLAHVENSIGFVLEGISEIQKAHDFYYLALQKEDGIAAYNLGRLYSGAVPLFKKINHQTAYHLFKLGENNSNDTTKSMLDFKFFMMRWIKN